MSARPAKILSQLKNANTPVPIEFFVQAKAKEPPTDALPRFVQEYTKYDRVATLTKESPSGKLVDEWTKAVSEAQKKPAVVDMAPAVGSFLAVKDDEELVCVTTFRVTLDPHLHSRNLSERLLTSRQLCSLTMSPPNWNPFLTVRPRSLMMVLLVRSRIVSGMVTVRRPRVLI